MTNNIAIVRSFIDDVYNAGKLDRLQELIGDRYMHDDPLTGELLGRDALRDLIQEQRRAFPDLTITVEDIGAMGDRVYTRWVARGSHRGEFMGVSPTNRSGEVRGMSIDRIVNGKIVEHQEVFDTLALFQIIGAVPSVEKLVKANGDRPRGVAAAR